MQRTGNSFLNSIPPVTKNLLIINFLLWFATIVLRQVGIIDLQEYLGMHFWRSSEFNVAQLITYMFMHDSSGFVTGFSHIFFNMFSLWMFGVVLERVLGAKRYLFYYLTCGLGAALVQQLAWEFTWKDMLLASTTNSIGMSADELINLINAGKAAFTLDDFYSHLITVGASGAVFGILLAFGMIFPNMRMFIIFIPIPIKAKWMVIGYGLIELLFGVTGQMGNVAHFAHLGGMLFGILLILYWKHKGIIGGYNGYN